MTLARLRPPGSADLRIEAWAPGLVYASWDLLPGLAGDEAL